MRNTFGSSLTITLFGESHGEMIGAVLDGMSPGVPVDEAHIKRRLGQRNPAFDFTTARREDDDFKLVSGVYEGKTTGAPITILIPNHDTRSQDYRLFSDMPRPSHADYTAEVKYHGFADMRGGGHFSGRMTAAIVAAGALVECALKRKGIVVASHIARLHGIADRGFEDVNEDALWLERSDFSVLCPDTAQKMQLCLMEAKEAQDSVGGIIETVVCGLPAGLGEPFFDTVEGLISHALFSIPAVKGVSFGEGFGMADLYGSQANDAFTMVDGKVTTKTNHSGGVLGGITTGMDVRFSTVVKPTPSIGKEQLTWNKTEAKEMPLSCPGRHDSGVVVRVPAVVNAMTYLTLADLLLVRYGQDYFLEENQST